MPERTENEIKLAVRRRYAAASQGTACCCGDATMGGPQGLDVLSLGCGSPVKFADIEPGMTVLDLGSGGGVDAFAASRRMFGEGKVLGVDSTPEMVVLAKETASKRGMTNVEFRLGEIEGLPVERETVDVILSNCVINLVPDKKKAFGEAYRVLKHGGSLTISDIVAEKPLPATIRGDLEERCECEAGSLTKEELRTLLYEAGFVDFKTLDETMWGEAGDVKLASLTFSARKP
ncbi:MAG: methyltransferase domain-containing protein [Conexivisphaerales archaeon]